MDDLRRYSPRFVHLNDALAFGTHLVFITNGCKLVGLNEEQHLDDMGSVPDGWNASPELYQFKYVHNESKAIILVKILYMDTEVVVSAVQATSEQIFTLDITVADHINVDADLGDYDTLYRDFAGLVVLLKEQIANQVLPQPASGGSGARPPSGGVRDPGGDPLRIGPVRGGHPYGGVRPDGGVPFGGDFGRDLDPFAGSAIGGIPVGGGNLMGPGHGRFNPGGRRGSGGRGRGPFPGVPPGARYDPFGPGPGPDHFKPPGSRGSGGGFGGGGFGGII